MKQRLTIIGILTALAVSTLYVLHASTDKPNKQRNGFIRTFDKIEAKIVAHLDISGVSISKICGAKGDSIFLNGQNPSKIFVTTGEMNKLDTISLNIPNIPKLIPAFTISVKYPYAYIFGGNAKCLIIGNMIDGNVKVIKLNTDGVFGNGLMIHPDKFIVRVVDRTTRNALFKTFDSAGKLIDVESNLSLPLSDAGFTYAGRIDYDEASNSLLYISFYLNEFVCFDTNLKQLYKSNTIDTNFSVKTTLKRSSTNVTVSNPTVPINTFSRVYDGVLYSKSKLKGDNENPDDFSSNSVIDKYDVKTGKYLSSFYIPNFKNQELGQFHFMRGERIVGLSEGQLFIYNIDKR